ncbi:hypothetical protein GJ496_002380 [Pomphorhynchus laevis]|nr:hypothetical protein GJ496_004608 [Pomphorhynchus laevis]KAI0988244.1 hypothetical protein GJ496_002380 [Pomphorhynchus laevis]
MSQLYCQLVNSPRNSSALVKLLTIPRNQQQPQPSKNRCKSKLNRLNDITTIMETIARILQAGWEPLVISIPYVKKLINESGFQYADKEDSVKALALILEIFAKDIIYESAQVQKKKTADGEPVGRITIETITETINIYRQSVDNLEKLIPNQ